MKRLNILLIGGANSLANQLIRQFNKEGHRVSLLTGSPHGGQTYPRVFERYDFSYTSEAIPEVFQSVAPDLTVFTGAYDANFPWVDERRDAVNYVSAVMNILTSYSMVGKGRFLFISSDEVFAADKGTSYTEGEALNADNPHGAALVQAEDICRRFMEDVSTDIILARLSGYYHLPKTPEDVDNAVSEFCLRYLKDGAVPMPDDQVMTPLSEADAVYFLTRLATTPTHKESVYHISSGKEISAGELKQMIGEAAAAAGYQIPTGEAEKADSASGKGLKARLLRHLERRAGGGDPTADRKRSVAFTHLNYPQAVLDVSRFREEFGVNRLADLGKDVRAITAHMLQNAEAFLNAGPEQASLAKLLIQELGVLFHAAVPFLENLICFVAVFLLNTRVDGSRFIEKIDLYLIYVLLFAILYGQHQAIFSAFLASVGFLFFTLRGNAGGGVLLDYNTYVWIAHLFILGLAVGYLKDRLTDQKSEAVLDYEHMTQQIDDVREINRSNVRVKDALQTEVINQNDSIGKIYEITSTLDRYNSEDVFFHAMDILRQIMGSDDIALYTVANGDYARLFSASSNLAASLGNSIRYRELPGLYEAVKDGKPYINRSLQEGLPMMACGIREGEELRTIIMIWSLPWEKMTLGQAGILSVTSMLIQNAVLRAQRFLDVMHAERFIGETRILKPEAFASILESYHNAAKEHLTRYTLLRIEEAGAPAIELGNQASGLLRQDDHLGLGTDGSLYVLLPNTSLKNAEFAIRRLGNGGLKTAVVDTVKDEEAV